MDIHELGVALSENAEAWWEEQGNQIPERDTPEWDELYRQWVESAG